MKRESDRPAGTSTTELVNGVQLSAADRQVAIAALQRGEAIADALYRAIELVNFAIEAGLRGARALAQRVRALRARPVRS
jgi:hypothetical protein